MMDHEFKDMNCKHCLLVTVVAVALTACSPSGNTTSADFELRVAVALTQTAESVSRLPTPTDQPKATSTVDVTSMERVYVKALDERYYAWKKAVVDMINVISGLSDVSEILSPTVRQLFAKKGEVVQREKEQVFELRSVSPRTEKLNKRVREVVEEWSGVLESTATAFGNLETDPVGLSKALETIQSVNPNRFKDVERELESLKKELLS